MTKRMTLRERADGYPLGPFNINDDAWYYVQRDGVLFVAELRTYEGGYIGTVQNLIKWTDVRNMLAIKDHKPRAARRERKRK